MLLLTGVDVYLKQGGLWGMYIYAGGGSLYGQGWSYLAIFILLFFHL